MIEIPVILRDAEAWAMAQFVKRLGFDDCQRLGDRHDGGHEAEQMWSAIQKLQAALAEVGFAPR